MNRIRLCVKGYNSTVELDGEQVTPRRVEIVCDAGDGLTRVNMTFDSSDLIVEADNCEVQLGLPELSS